MFGLRKNPAPAQAAAARALDAARVAARAPALFGPGRIPDTLDGRFESMVLHVILIHERVRQEGVFGAEVCQEMFDALFAELDAALREIGTGDLSVGKKVRKMGEAFYGRLSSYRAALEADDDDVLKATLERNVFAIAAPEPAFLDRLVDHVRACRVRLAEQLGESLLGEPGPSLPHLQA